MYMQYFTCTMIEILISTGVPVLCLLMLQSGLLEARLACWSCRVTSATFIFFSVRLGQETVESAVGSNILYVMCLL